MAAFWLKCAGHVYPPGVAANEVADRLIAVRRAMGYDRHSCLIEFKLPAQVARRSSTRRMKEWNKTMFSINVRPGVA